MQIPEEDCCAAPKSRLRNFQALIPKPSSGKAERHAVGEAGAMQAGKGAVSSRSQPQFDPRCAVEALKGGGCEVNQKGRPSIARRRMFVRLVAADVARKASASAGVLSGSEFRFRLQPCGLLVAP
jgi:hypothetical protein